MVLTLINGSGTILAGMKFQWARLTPIRWKQTMPSCDIILLVWLENRVVSLAVLSLWNVLYDSLCIVSIVDNFISNVSQIMPHMSWIS